MATQSAMVPALSGNEEAKQAFLTALDEIEGVEQIRRTGGAHLAEQSFEVVIASRNSPAWRAVRELEQRILDQYPNAKLDVRLSELRPRHAKPV